MRLRGSLTWRAEWGEGSEEGGHPAGLEKPCSQNAYPRLTPPHSCRRLSL